MIFNICGLAERRSNLKYIKLFSFLLILIVALTVCSCDRGVNYIKNPDEDLKSDSDDYFVPNIYVDVEDKDYDDSYGEYIPIS